MLLVKIHKDIVLNVLLTVTELLNQPVIVMKDISNLMNKLNVKNVMTIVIYVKIQALTVFPVLMDMLIHQNVLLPHQLLNLLKYKISQSVLFKYSTVLKLVKLVNNTQTTVDLVMLTELNHQFVTVSQDSMKIMKFVILVEFLVKPVKLIIIVLFVLLTESIHQLVVVLQVSMMI